MEHEAAAFGARARLDGTYEQHMVASDVAAVMPVLERGDAAFDQRCASRSEAVRDAAEVIGVRP